MQLETNYTNSNKDSIIRYSSHMGNMISGCGQINCRLLDWEKDTGIKQFFSESEELEV